VPNYADRAGLAWHPRAGRRHTSGMRRELEELEELAGGSIAWAPCQCCQRPAAVCNSDAATVWNQELASLDISAVLQYGCAQLPSPSASIVLRYPAVNATSGRKLLAAPQQLGNVPVNTVRC
jgi:hypothetical protein